MELANITSGVTITDSDLAKITAAALAIQTANGQTTPAPTASAITFISEYLRVNASGIPGRTIDVQKAIDMAAASGGGSIVLEPGTYTAPAGGWIIPDVSIDIQGVSKESVTLQNTAESSVFVLHNLTKAYNLSNFNITSQNTSTYSSMIYIYGDTSDDNDAIVNINNIGITLVDGGVELVTVGDTGILVSTGSSLSNVTVNGIKVVNGAYGIRFYNASPYLLGKAIITNNVLDHVKIAGIAAQSSYFNVANNVIANMTQTGIDCNSMTTESVSIVGNKISSRSDTAVHLMVTGISAANMSNIVISENNVRITPTLGEFTSKGMALYATYSKVTNNIVVIDVTSVSRSYGIWSDTLKDSVVSGNTLKIDNSDTTETHYGFLGSSGTLRNVISSNNIDMVNNDAKDIGISLASGADNNQGGDNVTYRCGTGISDSGTGNAVTGKDV